MTTDKLQVFRFGDGVWDPSHRFVTSWLVSPWALFAIRASISLYAFFVLLFAIFWEIAQLPNGAATARFSFSYFTILCYWGISFYFFFAALHTFTYARSGIPLLSRFPRPLQALHALYYSTIICYPILVTIVFWGVIFRVSVPVGWFPTTFDAWSNISEHGLNSLFALFEICIPRTPSPPWFHLLWLIVILACYLGLAYITVATKHQYVYSFLNPKVAQHGMVAAYVFGIAVGICLIFAVVKGAVSLRVWVTETRGGRRGKFAKVGELQIAEVEMQRFEGKA